MDEELLPAAEGIGREIATSPASLIEMLHSAVFPEACRAAWDDGDHDEPQGANAPGLAQDMGTYTVPAALVTISANP